MFQLESLHQLKKLERSTRDYRCINTLLFVHSITLCFVLQYGGVFSFTMVGKTFTYLIGSNSSALFFNSKNHDLNAEEVYSKLVTPVFGKGVAYDVPNKVREYAILHIYEYFITRQRARFYVVAFVCVNL